MTTPILLPGGTAAFGTAIDNTGTDVFSIYDADNAVFAGAGNLQVYGNPLGNLLPPPILIPDTRTTVTLKNATGVNDAITIDGSNNLVRMPGALLTNAVVTVKIDTFVSATGQGGNAVTLNLAGASIAAVTVGGNLPAGGNLASIANAGGTTAVALSGAGNTVTLTGDIANTVTTGLSTAGFGAALISIGAPDDNAFASNSTVTVAGNTNRVTIGDAAASVTGGVNANVITAGDGNDFITLAGTGNLVLLGGGNDTVNIGGGGATILILGVDLLNLPAFADPSGAPGDPPTPDDSAVPISPNDVITIAGVLNTVAATYENVTLNGGAGQANVALGNGNDNVALGGNHNTVAIGSGTNSLTLSGDSNVFTVIDASGIGFDTVSLGAGQGDTINLGGAGGSIIDTGTGKTTVTQSSSATSNVFINLNNGTADITIGDGTSIIMAGGDNSTVRVGHGANNITAKGAHASITGGNGNDTVKAGGFAWVNVGAGADSITTGATSTVTAGNGNETIVTGSNSAVTGGNGQDKVTVGGGSTVALGNGADTIALLGGASFVTIGQTFVHSNETVTGFGNGNVINAPGDGNDVISLTGNADKITLGNGRDSVTVIGAGATVSLGNGNDSAIKTGATSTVTAGNGHDDTVSVGAGSTVSLGNGARASVTAGSNARVTVGSGDNDTVSIGSFSALTINAAGNSLAHDIITVADSATVSAGGGYAVIHGSSNDTFYLNGLKSFSDVALTGSNNMVFIGANATLKVDLNGAQTGNAVTVQAAGTDGKYTGAIELLNFNTNAWLDLNGLTGADGQALTNYFAALGNLTAVGGNAVLSLLGGGAITFDGSPAFQQSQFVFGGNTGPVHP